MLAGWRKAHPRSFLKVQIDVSRPPASCGRESRPGSLDHPLTILPDQAIEIVAIEKKVMVGRVVRWAYWRRADWSRRATVRRCNGVSAFETAFLKRRYSFETVHEYATRDVASAVEVAGAAAGGFPAPPDNQTVPLSHRQAFWRVGHPSPSQRRRQCQHRWDEVAPVLRVKLRGKAG